MNILYLYLLINLMISLRFVLSKGFKPIEFFWLLAFGAPSFVIYLIIKE